ncbi:uncharacterized protein LOC129765226 [Toxorhynchites rutilus septentrionalis]|uniref:uncharacterized protein LOC129765226 n=1 Tax=Toxorhynchites rutilus septentrionalis TaxID=329112 RepID=UPI00247A66DD|nr:uncharacterized protein LOC129765226 [Toxorhynchites rutilus septentrionalis]XP_055621275.1 uncharacterized protein LOC129765226 [Toxorhynchites rutilus septentrionalis]
MSSTELEKSTNATSFVNLPVDDGSLTTPMAIGVGKANAGDISMSDEEGRVITTLESPKYTFTSTASKDTVIIHSQTIIRPAKAGLKELDKAGKDASSAKKTEDLLAKMKSRLSKQIDLKLVTPPKSQQSPAQGDTSGSIEIPHDLILSSDIPQTPLSSAAAAKELEDHDLIAILEGDDVEITENATEIEVRVGRGEDGSYNDDQVLEEIQISFVDEQDVEQEQKDREKEIAMRQMANLPILPKGRRPKSKTQVPFPVIPKSPNGPPKLVTIKGQTTIKPVPRPIVIKNEPEDEISPLKKHIPVSKPVPKVTPVAIHKARIMSPPATPKTVIPAPKPSPKDIINSLVSDWDDEPIVLKEEQLSPAKQSPKQPRVSTMGPPPMGPPSIEEPPKRSRIIKKKIIWDPDNPETHMSFASFVKSNRARTQPEEPEHKDTPVTARPPGTGFRRKRAESVAVHMIKDTPYIPPPFLKRARTPEPVNKTIRPISIPKGPTITRKKKSEIEKLLGDEGAINMLYDVECENSNKDLLKDADINLDSDDEDEKLQAKAKIITDAVIKQGTSPNETSTHVPRVRTKRASTPQQQTSVSPAPTLTTTVTTTRKSAGTAGSGPGRKRKQTSASDDWDYVYSSRKTNDDAMIIRRRSNSSYSSSTSPRRLSVEQQAATNETPTEPAESTSFEFVKPSSKISPKPGNIKLDSSLVANMKGKLSKALGNKPNVNDALNVSIPSSSSAREPPEKKAKVSPKPKVMKSETITTTVKVAENGNSSLSGESTQDKLDELKLSELSCKLCGNYAEVVLAPKETKLKDVFTVELMNELKDVLNSLKNDPIIRVVLIRSTGKHFSRGIDVSYLIQPNAEKRKNAAQVFSGHLRNFLQILASFNKPLVAAVHGDVLGLGVTMLPLFEVVIAQDNSTFYTPYAVFGQLPEAMKIFSTSKNLKPKAITDLLYLGKKISATTALDYGIITDVVASEKLQDRANSITKKLASLSSQAHKSIKSNLRQELLGRLYEQLVSEQKKLCQQWVTPECQEKFKQFVSRGGEW